MPGPGFEGYEAYQRWESGSARITSTYALNAPTIGCATLDGLDRTGYPYNFVEVNTPDWADTLTSMPIALNGYFPESNIHLMFYVQGGEGAMHPIRAKTSWCLNSNRKTT